MVSFDLIFRYFVLDFVLFVVLFFYCSLGTVFYFPECSRNYVFSDGGKLNRIGHISFTVRK